MKVDQILEIQQKSTFIIEFWKILLESKYSHLKKTACPNEVYELLAL